MAVVGLVCDTHYGARNDSLIFLRQMARSMEFFFEECKKRNVKQVIHAGDLFDRQKQVNYVTAMTCRETFLIPSDVFDEVHIICGNHDHTYKNTHEVNSLRELVAGKYGWIKTYSVPETIKIDGLEILLVPWITETNAHASHFEIQRSKADVLIGHLEVKGFPLQKGMINEKGFSPSDLSKFDLVLSGHFHHRSKAGNIQYLGAFTQFTWADYDDPRGFAFLDTETRQIEYVDNPHQMFYKIPYDEDSPPHFKTLQHINESYVEVVVKKKTNLNRFDKWIDELYILSPIHIDIRDIEIQESDLEIDLDEATDTPTIIADYIESVDLPVDKQLMKKFMREVYDEALSLEFVE